jgi:hypothetical protein
MDRLLSSQDFGEKISKAGSLPASNKEAAGHKFEMARRQHPPALGRTHRSTNSQGMFHARQHAGTADHPSEDR